MAEDDSNFKIKRSFKIFVFIACLILCCFPFVTPPWALLIGIIVANSSGHPFLNYNSKVTTKLLQISIVGLGFGINLQTAMATGIEGFWLTLATICLAVLAGICVGWILKVDKKTSILLSCGTAICGGSAIAAVSPIIKADEKQMTVALGTVFILNAFALFLFPTIGEHLELSQKQFGVWCALAIHDTSSVVGAASKYGKEALEIATTLKLTRALWIIPMALGASLFYKSDTKKIKIPYFILFFILAMIISSLVPAIASLSPYIVRLARTSLTITLFLIGAGMSKNMITSVGAKPFFQGIIIWLLLSISSLLFIVQL